MAQHRTGGRRRAVRGSSQPQSSQSLGSGFIAELHGVRGIALALVVLFHVFGQGRVSGGVDVFLFFSGFLLTGSMFRRSVDRSPGPVARHYARTLLRLLPAALTVLAAVVVAILVLRPLSSQGQDLREVRASLLYYENWELIWSQLTYGAAGPDASPLQHFWSLSLQGQFFLLWPWFVVALVAWVRRTQRDPWNIVFGATTILTIAGFAVAQVMVRDDQSVAYFSAFSRWWELSAGGLLALILMRWTPPHRVRPILGWAGLMIVIAGGFVVDGASVFPGPWVLIPLTGAACVLLGAGASRGPHRLLQTRPLTRLADMAYELYLWHWPILIFVLVVQDRPAAGPRTGVFVVVVSVAAAWLTHVLVTRPFEDAKSARPSRVLAPIAAVLTTAAVLTSTLAVQADRSVEQSLDLSSYTDTDYPGAASVFDPTLAQKSYSAPVGPPADVAASDREPGMGSACWQSFRTPPEPLGWCNDPVAAAGPTVALVGSSRALAWQPAFQEVASQNDWSLRVTARGSCPFGAEATNDSKEGCAEWNDLVLANLLAEPPDAVVIEGTEVSKMGAKPERVVAPDGRARQALLDAGIDVFMLRAAPRFLEAPAECAQRIGGEPVSPCDQRASTMFDADSPIDDVAKTSDRLHGLDLVPYYCPEGTCPVVLGNLITFRDTRHFTATFARTLAPALDSQMREAEPELFETQ